MKKALVVYGGWDGHDPKKVAHFYKKTLEGISPGSHKADLVSHVGRFQLLATQLGEPPAPASHLLGQALAYQEGR